MTTHLLLATTLLSTALLGPAVGVAGPLRTPQAFGKSLWRLQPPPPPQAKGGQGASRPQRSVLWVFLMGGFGRRQSCGVCQGLLLRPRFCVERALFEIKEDVNNINH